MPPESLPKPQAGQTIRVEICAAWPDHVLRQELTVPLGTTVQALRRMPGLSQALRKAWAEAAGIGVFGMPKPAREALHDGDRIELWRPLAADPKEARRQRARLKGLDAAAPRRRKSGAA